MKHSTGTPTKAEAARIEAAKLGPCIACLLRHERGELSFSMVAIGGDYHHLLRGGIRRGHRWGVCLCAWHHRRQPWADYTHAQMYTIYGPSLLDGSKRFHEEIGTDEELLARQDALIGWVDEEAA